MSIKLLLGYAPKGKDQYPTNTMHTDHHGDGNDARRDSLYAVQLNFVGTERLRAVAPAHVSVLSRKAHMLGPLKEAASMTSQGEISRASSIDDTVAVGAGGKLVRSAACMCETWRVIKFG